MKTLTVSMKIFLFHTKQQEWNDAIKYVFDHNFYLSMRPNRHDKSSNRKYIMRRQWYLGQNFMLLSFFQRYSSTIVWFKNQFRFLFNRYKIHAANRLNQIENHIVDDFYEKCFYDDIQKVAEQIKIDYEFEMKSFEISSLIDVWIWQLKNAFVDSHARVYSIYNSCIKISIKIIEVLDTNSFYRSVASFVISKYLVVFFNAVVCFFSKVSTRISFVES